MGDDTRPATGEAAAELAAPELAAPDLAAPDLAGEQVILEQDFDVDSLFALRAAVSAHAAAATLSGNRLYDVVTVAHELAANAVRHGAGHGRLRLWIRDGVLHCEVSDDGPAPPATRPEDEAPWQEQHGHGLWVIGQVADQFTIDRGADTTVTAAFRIGPGRGPA